MKTTLIIALSLILSSVALAENPYAKYGTRPSYAESMADQTESYSTRDINTGEMSQSTITRHWDGTVDVDTFDYGTGNTTHYYGDSDGGSSYNYGTGEMESVYGNPYGASEGYGGLPAFEPMEW